MWTRAVWFEDDVEEEGVIQAVWMKDGYVYWPPGHNALEALTEKCDPTDKWTKFNNMLIKMKISSGKHGKQVHSHVCISEFKCC